MSTAVERFIRVSYLDGDKWRTLPTGLRIRVWESATAETEDGSKLMLFHIGFFQGIVRGYRVTYLGSDYDLLEVSDSKRLVGMELRCKPVD